MSEQDTPNPPDEPRRRAPPSRAPTHTSRTAGRSTPPRHRRSWAGDPARPVGPAPGVEFAPHGARLVAYIVDGLIISIVLAAIADRAPFIALGAGIRFEPGTNDIDLRFDLVGPVARFAILFDAGDR